MSGELGTTNLLLGIMAAVSVFEPLLLIGVGIGAAVLYRRVTYLIAGLETRQIAPAVAKVNVILEDVRGVTAKVREETERVDHAIRTTMDRVDDTADRVRWNVRTKTSWLIGVIRGARVALESLLHTDHQPHESRT